MCLEILPATIFCPFWRLCDDVLSSRNTVVKLKETRDDQLDVHSIPCWIHSQRNMKYYCLDSISISLCFRLDACIVFRDSLRTKKTDITCRLNNRRPFLIGLSAVTTAAIRREWCRRTLHFRPPISPPDVDVFKFNFAGFDALPNRL